MVLDSVINAPVVVRIVWHTTKRMKEMRLLLPTASQTGQVLDGECNVLYNIDVVFLEYTPNGVPRSESCGRRSRASTCATARAARVIFAPIGGRLANGRVEMLGFVTPRRTFDQVLVARQDARGRVCSAGAARLMEALAGAGLGGGELRARRTSAEKGEVRESLERERRERRRERSGEREKWMGGKRFRIRLTAVTVLRWQCSATVGREAWMSSRHGVCHTRWVEAHRCRSPCRGAR